MYFRFSFDIFIHTYIHTYIIHFYLRHKVDTQHTYLTLFAVRRVAQTSKTDRREHFISATIRVETDLVTNCREWSTATRSGSGDSSTACPEREQIGRHSWKRMMMMMTIRTKNVPQNYRNSFWRYHFIFIVIFVLVSLKIEKNTGSINNEW